MSYPKYLRILIEALAPRMGYTLIPPHPEIKVETNRLPWLKDWLRYWGVKLEHIPLDNIYYMASEEDMLNIIAWDWIDKRKWISQKFDCDDFAFAFKSHVSEYFGLNQVGWVNDYSGRHSFNLIIFPTGHLWVFEPQTDSFAFLNERNRDTYPMERGLLLL